MQGEENRAGKNPLNFFAEPQIRHKNIKLTILVKAPTVPLGILIRLSKFIHQARFENFHMEPSHRSSSHYHFAVSKSAFDNQHYFSQEVMVNQKKKQKQTIVKISYFKVMRMMFNYEWLSHFFT